MVQNKRQNNTEVRDEGRGELGKNNRSVWLWPPVFLSVKPLCVRVGPRACSHLSRCWNVWHSTKHRCLWVQSSCVEMDKDTVSLCLPLCCLILYIPKSVCPCLWHTHTHTHTLAVGNRTKLKWARVHVLTFYTVFWKEFSLLHKKKDVLWRETTVNQ